MKKYLILSVLFLIYPFSVFGEPEEPENLILTPSDTEITVTWDANTENDDTDGYNICYWDSDEGSEAQCTEIKLPHYSYNKFIIKGLESETEYKVKLEAFDNDGNDSDDNEKTISTLASPAEFFDSLNLGFSSMENSIKIEWEIERSNEDDQYLKAGGYYLYWKKKDDLSDTGTRIDFYDSSVTEYTLKGLESKTEYNFEIEVYNDDFKSDKTSGSATTSSPGIDVEITGSDSVSVSLEAQAIDFKEFRVKIGTSSGGSDIYVSGSPVAKGGKEDIDGLSSGTYYISAELFDESGEVVQTLTSSFVFDNPGSFLESNKGKAEGGCFVDSLKISRAFLFFVFGVFSLVISVRYLKIRKFIPFIVFLFIGAYDGDVQAGDYKSCKNFVGVKVGLFEPFEDGQKDVYDEIYISSIFYERTLWRFISTDIEAGYSKTTGTSISSASGAELPETELIIYPIALSVNLNYDVNSFLSGYVGFGGDWWMIEESSDFSDYSENIGGWHVKGGVKLFAKNLNKERFQKVGLLFETSYSTIDRLGKNDVDLGGLRFNIGVICGF